MGRETRYYKASLDKLAIGITTFIFLLFGGIASAQLHHYLKAGEGASFWPVVFTLVFFILVILITWLFHPTGYSVNSDRLTIHRPFSAVTFRLEDIRKVSALSKEDMRWTARTFGNGGLFGYYGKFWNTKFGTMTWYTTQRNHYVMVETATRKKILLSPDKLQLAEDLNSYLEPTV